MSEEIGGFEVPENLPDWIRNHVRDYLETNGENGHMWDSSIAGGPGPVPTLLLRTKGRRSGRYVTLPLIYGEADAGYVIVASKGGAPADPAWFLNLSADPEAAVQVGAERHRVKARVAEGREREELWARMTKVYAPYDDYQANTDRTIPVVVLEPMS